MQTSPVTDPVFILCSGRSGSTLLRFVLDAHPDLACPPETNLPILCSQLVNVWALIEGMPLSPERGDESLAEIPDAAIEGVRHTMDLMLSAFLERHGSKRYCDKSLNTARFVDTLMKIYPAAKFLCLYRHPMDVVASGIEACPWGLNGYGFDPYIAGSPGNAVLALARFWVENTAAIIAAEDQFPASCHRIRYEDLVTDPQGTADSIFRFLNVAAVPEISTKCFTADRERFGLGDYKIWHTSDFTAASVGRGWTVPVGLIPAPILDQVNGLANRLGYIEIDDSWGTAAVPADVRATANHQRTMQVPLDAAKEAVETGEILIGDRLQAALERMDDDFTRRWDSWISMPFGVVVTPPVGGGIETRWRIDLKSPSIRQLSPKEEDDTDWDILGTAETWEGLLRGRVNLGVALRRYDLRYCDTGGSNSIAAAARVDMLADLLRLTSWRLPRSNIANGPAISIEPVSRTQATR